MQKLHLLNAKQTVVSFHGSDLHFHNAKYYNKLFSSDFRFTVNSKYMANRLSQMGAVKAEIVPMGVNDVFFGETNKEDKTELFTILTVARLIDVKGIEYGLKAVKKVIDEGNKLQYRIIGEGHLLDELKRLTVKLDIAEQVHFLGAKTQEEIQGYYKEAEVFLLPGITTKEGAREAQGIVILEAQAMKLPVIVTDAGGMKEGMIDNKTGFVVPEKDVPAMADKIQKLIGDKNLRRKMGDAGREFVKQNFNNKILTKKLLDEVYQL